MSKFTQRLTKYLVESKPGDLLLVWPDNYSVNSKYLRKLALDQCRNAANSAGATIKCRCKNTGIQIEVIE